MKAGNDKIALGWSLVISGLVHTLSGVVAAAATSVPASAPTAPEIPPVEFTVIEPDPSPEERVPAEPRPEPEPDRIVAPSPAVRERAAREPRPSADRPGPVTAERSPAEPDDALPVEIPPDETEKRPATRGVPGGLQLDPRAVAMAALASEGPSAPHVSAEEAPGPTDDQRTAELNERHSRFLNETANAKDWARRREPPQFQPRKDGSYVYSGHAFSARIRPDGTIAFSDRDGINFDRTGTNDGKSLGARFSFDLADGAYRRRGKDPYQAERDYVLRGSEELRDRLAAEHREKENDRALLRLSGRLERTWTSERDAASRRRAIFELWDGLSEDDVGAQARAAIVDFVSERLPAGSDEAFSPEELARLNRGRRSRAPFRPYR